MTARRIVLDVLKGDAIFPPPLWLMRQAGRYLPEYREVRKNAGADAVQIFDSWSGVLDEASFESFCVAPVVAMVGKVRAARPDVPIIGFPKGAGSLYEAYRARTGVTALGLDWTVPFAQARALQVDGAIQGNLDPLRLVAGGEALAAGVDAILTALGNGPLIFNLGHGITPQTPLSHVEAMVKQVRDAVR